MASVECTGVGDGCGYVHYFVGAKLCLSVMTTGQGLNIFEKHVEYFECIDMKW